VSNNIFEIQDVLGVEAARQAIINQTNYIMKEQGLNTNVRYIMLLADLMTASGTIRSIGRYGISGQKASMLVRASFEETKKHLVSASVRGEKDDFLGTVENVMVNQVAPIGTGAFNLIGHIPSAVCRAKAETKPGAEEHAGKTAKKKREAKAARPARAKRVTKAGT
jgi:DNA-directed RNA polymerase subunit A"